MGCLCSRSSPSIFTFWPGKLITGTNFNQTYALPCSRVEFYNDYVLYDDFGICCCLCTPEKVAISNIGSITHYKQYLMMSLDDGVPDKLADCVKLSFIESNNKTQCTYIVFTGVLREECERIKQIIFESTGTEIMITDGLI
jgi:hypothetical protein